jgi:hypothetical protein
MAPPPPPYLIPTPAVTEHPKNSKLTESAMLRLLTIANRQKFKTNLLWNHHNRRRPTIAQALLGSSGEIASLVV